MEELMTNSLAKWAIIMGLVMITALVISSAIFLIATTVKAMRVTRLKVHYKQIANVLYEVMLKNQTTNPQLSNLAKLMLQQLDPSSGLFTKDVSEVKDILSGTNSEAQPQDLKDAAKPI